MNILLAVSGGIDSVVLLDLVSKTRHQNHIVIAHVDHGIRKSSGDDARFVSSLARRYNLPFVSTSLALDEHASEEAARTARYDFLKSEAERFSATIMTAHHQDDLIETIAINCHRGTGWRGLAVMGSGKIARPLLAMTKAQLYMYALRHRLEWVEDETNSTDHYLRNRLRKKINRMIDTDAQNAILRLRERQIILRHDIDCEIARLVERSESRHFLIHCGDRVAEELIGALVCLRTGQNLMYPEKSRALHAVKTAKPGTTHQIARGVELQFTSRNLTVRVV